LDIAFIAYSALANTGRNLGNRKMTDLNETANTLGSLETVQKAEFTPDDLRAEVQRLTTKLADLESDLRNTNGIRVSETERANKYMDKCQTTAAALFDLMEGEIVACFTGLLEDLGDNPEFERRIESMIEDGIENADTITDSDVERAVEDALERTQFIDGDDVDERISDAIGDSSFDAAVRDVVREMITDGDIVLSIDVS
jgi:hypothetical protein